MKYHAFISYSHKDRKFAKWLHKKIESYKIPEEIRKLSKINRLFPVFLDEEELNLTSNLPQSLQDNLLSSKYLIVISSEASAKSKWVYEEIKFFKTNKEKENIIVLYAGERKSSEISDFEFKNIRYFPESLVRKIDNNGILLAEYENDPLFLDFTLNKSNTKKHILKIIATLLDVELSMVEKREEILEKRRKAYYLIISLIFIITLALGLYQWHNSNQLFNKLIDSNYEKERNEVMLESAKKRAELAAKIAADLSKRVQSSEENHKDIPINK